PLNVHVNRYPVTGKVVYMKHHHGKYLVAWHPKSSTENERVTTVIKKDDGSEVLIRQIAGIMARRIIPYGREGLEVKRGEELGFIRFGSRVDLFLPLNTILDVKIGEKVKGNLDTVGTFT
ncbi:MAG: phosphatidylserine decarboxylase, partial [Bacteroidota bacterium]